MQKRTMALIALFSLLTVALVAVVLMASPAAEVKAQGSSPIEVDGLFYGDPDGAAPYDRDKDVYLHLAEDPGRGDLYYYVANGNLYFAMVVLPSVNDNVFGDMGYSYDKAYAKSAGWAGFPHNKHSAQALISSDNFEFRLVCGDNEYQWAQDLVEWDEGSGMFVSGVGGDAGDGTNAPPGLETASSTQWNLNSLYGSGSSWDYTLASDPGSTRRTTASTWKSVATDSPAGDDDDVTDEDGWSTVLTDTQNIWWNSNYNWEWALVYEASINLTAACGDNDWDVEVIAAHNSPPKSGDSNVVPKDKYDYGDLPDGPYPTYFASNGARHLLIDGGPILGSTVDKEGDGQPDSNALGDDHGSHFPPDDEDGVMPIGDKLIPGEPFTLSISGTSGAILDAWFDWDNDGVLSSSEHFRYTLTGNWTTFPFTATGYTAGNSVYARFRVSTGGVDSPTGAADDGEVEDYLFQGEATAVVLASFTASAYTNAVRVKWESATELDTMGYHIERADAPAGPWTQLNESLIGSRAPGSMLGAAYDHLDLAVEKGRTYYYRLVSIDTSGGASYYGPLTVVVPSIGEPLPPRSLAGPPYRIFLPFVMQSR